MAFPPKHNLPRLAIEWIKNNVISVRGTGRRVKNSDPGLLTRLYHGQKWNGYNSIAIIFIFTYSRSGHVIMEEKKYMLIKNGDLQNNHMIRIHEFCRITRSLERTY